MKAIGDFLSVPENLLVVLLIVLGILMVAFGILRHRQYRSKSILSKLTKKKVKIGLIDSILDRIEFIRKREEKLDFMLSVLDSKYTARTYTKMELVSIMIALLVSFYMKNWLIVGPMIIIGAMLPTFFIEIKVKKKQKLFNDQILEAFQMFITEYTTTKSVQKTIMAVSEKIKYPLKREFERLGRKLNSGEPYEECFMDFARRTQNRWTMVFAQMMITYFRNGGDFVPHLYQITENINDEKILAEQNTTELSSLRLINIILNALVPLAYITSKFINPQDTQVFVETSGGRVIIFFIVMGCLTSLLLGKKITDM